MTNTISSYHGLTVGFNQAKDKAASLLKRDPEKDKEFRQTQAVLQHTLSAMKNSKNDIAQQKKAMAQQKLVRIKEAIKNLKQMSFMDSKSVARMAARLARELAAAIKEYASSGATYSEISVASNGTNTVTETATDETAKAGTEVANTKANAEAQSTERVAEQEAITHPFKAYEQAQRFTKDDDEQNGHTKQAESGSENATIRRKDDDSKFVKDAKEMLEELRGLIKAQRNKLNQKLGQKSLFGRDDISDAEKALKEADRALASFTRLHNAH